MRRAVERLAAEHAEVPQIPDYSGALGRMAKAFNATMQNVGVLEKMVSLCIDRLDCGDVTGLECT